jgi:hypothetical protein
VLSNASGQERDTLDPNAWGNASGQERDTLDPNAWGNASGQERDTLDCNAWGTARPGMCHLGAYQRGRIVVH